LQGREVERRYVIWSGSVGIVNRMCERKGLHQSHDDYCHRRKMNKATQSFNLEDQNLGDAMKISKLVMM
jgi:hypothetical protein